MILECCLPAIVDQLDSSKLIWDRITTHLVCCWADDALTPLLETVINRYLTRLRVEVRFFARFELRAQYGEYVLYCTCPIVWSSRRIASSSSAVRSPPHNALVCCLLLIHFPSPPCRWLLLVSPQRGHLLPVLPFNIKSEGLLTTSQSTLIR